MNEKVVNVTGQALELGCTMLRAVPRDFPQELLLSMQNKSIEIRWLLRNHFDPLQIPFEEQFKQWEKFYQDVLGISLGGWEHIHIPERQYGFNRLVIVAGGLDSNVRPGTLGFINEKVAGVSWEREASEQIIEINQRGSDNDRAMWVRDELNAVSLPYELVLKTSGLSTQTMTLLEYVLNAAEYFYTTGEILDGQFEVACLGTRWRNSKLIPLCYCGPNGNIIIGSQTRGSAANYLHARQVIS